MKAVVLAAGEGARLQPITATRPKHLIEVAGKPVLEHNLEALKSSGIDEVIIVTHYLGDMIHRYFGDGKRFGLKLKYVEQATTIGTGNAVSTAEPYIEGDFVLVYGDLLFTYYTIRKMIHQYNLEKPAAVIAVAPVEKTEDYGIIELRNEKMVSRIFEKPPKDKAPSNLANAGIYVLSREVFGRIKRIKPSIRGEFELTDALSLLIDENLPVVAAKISKDSWMDIGNPWDLLKANSLELKRIKRQILGNVEEGAHLFGKVAVAETARIRSGAYIEGPSFVGENSDIGPNCYIRPYTSIGRNVRVGNACEVKNSIIMDGTHVGHLSYVGDSILCERCNLGAGTLIANYRFDARTVKMRIRDQMVDSKRRKLGAVLGDNVRTGVGAVLMPGVKIGVNSRIGPNFVVYSDLPANISTK